MKHLLRAADHEGGSLLGVKGTEGTVIPSDLFQGKIFGDHLDDIGPTSDPRYNLIGNVFLQTDLPYEGLPCLSKLHNCYPRFHNIFGPKSLHISMVFQVFPDGLSQPPCPHAMNNIHLFQPTQ